MGRRGLEFGVGKDDNDEEEEGRRERGRRRGVMEHFEEDSGTLES